MIELDGTYGEGGGQIVRTALALSTLTQQGFHVKDIRKGRKDAGLKMQHLHCIKALQKLTDAQAEGATLGSEELTFLPKPLKGKSLKVDIETAGSITLFLQAVLLPCCFADKPTKLEIIGGTDVAWSMPIDYFREVLVPQLRRWADIDVRTERRGYYPKGNGKVVVRIKPRDQQKPHLELTEQGHLMHIKGISHASKSLEEKRVSERQAHTAQQALARYNVPINIRSEYADTLSPGSGITLWAVFSKNKEDIDVKNPIILGADALGERGTPAETVGNRAAENLQKAISSGAPVDAHLADNLVPWLALSAPGRIKSAAITKHTTTNFYTVKKFMPVQLDVSKTTIEAFLK